MSMVRWIFPWAPLLVAACTCTETGMVGEQDADQEDPDLFEQGDDNGLDAVLPDALTLPPVCGDGVVDPGEECDDGNRQNGDGCDWMCRNGSDPYEYPPPDPDMRPVEPTGPPQVVTDETEMSIYFAGGVSMVPCHPIWLVAGGGRFALMYDYDQPYYGVALRVLDRAGNTVGDPWKRETSWSLFSQALFSIDEGFGLISGSITYGLLRSRFDLNGAPLEEFLTLRPSREIYEPWDEFVSGAYASGRWLAVSALCCLDYYGWLLETFSDDGAPVNSYTLHVENTGLCVSASATPTGFAVATGGELVVMDRDLIVASRSGHLGGEESNRNDGAVSLSPEGFWVAWSSNLFDDPSAPKSIWVAALDLDGTPQFPPREILEGLPSVCFNNGPFPPSGAPELAITNGPAGAAIVYWQGTGDPETDGGPVMLVTVDGWGNVITPPTPVLGEGEITTVGWVLAAAADDQGYGVVTMTPGEVPGTGRLVFRHFAALP